MPTLKWLLAGAGDIATRRVGPALVAAANSELVAICDLDGERATRLADQLGSPAVYTDYAAALAECEADAVYVATPQTTHIELSLAALAAGRHLLCEKPLALNGPACLPLLRAARESDWVTSCSNYRRLSEQYKLTTQLLASGAIGQLTAGWTLYSTPFYNPGGAPITQARGASRIKELGYYQIDIAHHFFGLPESVIAQGSVLHPEAMNDVEEIATVILRFAGGELFTLMFNCTTPGTRHELELLGTAGRITWPQWPPHGNGPVVLSTAAGTRELPAETDPNWHLPMVEDFVDAVLTGRAPVCTLDSAVQTEFITDAIFRSLASGRLEPILWDTMV